MLAKIGKVDTNFETKEGDTIIIKIDSNNLSLSGKDIFFNLIDKFPIDDPKVKLEITIDDSIQDSNDIQIVSEIKDILCEIADKIEKNKQDCIENRSRYSYCVKVISRKK